MWYEFDNFRLDATRRLLLGKSGASIALASKAVETLLYLVERRAAIVEKAELMSAVWPNVVVEENNLNQIISVLRRTLGESPGENRFIVTHPGRGYSFVADVKTVTSVTEATTTSMEHTVDRRRPSRARNTLSIVSIVVVTLLALITVGVAMWRDANRQREQRAIAIDAVAELLSKDQYGAAYMLALPLIKDTGADQRQLSELWPQIVSPLRPLVSEAGATVHFKSYADVTGDWLFAGVTPFEKPIDAPRGVLRLKVEKPGFRTGYFVITNPGPSLQDELPSPALPIAKIPLPLIALQPTDSIAIPDDMVLVPRMTLPASQPGWPVGAPENIQFEMPAFAIARSEVTNQEYKEFIDAGGYDNEAYWQGLSFTENGKPLSFAEARKRFVDTTDRPGPAGWQLSTYRSGEAGLPVGGISWYEAMAYARFRGHTLPTVHHWARAAVSSYGGFFNCAPAIIALSRFSADGPVAASEEIGLGPWGTVSMFGNVREWALNFAGDKALAVGGGWSDYAGFTYAAQPMQRLPQFGLRLMHTLPGTEIRKELLQPIQLAFDSTDPHIEREPVSDEAFAAMRFQFVRTHVKPISQSVEVVKETPLWTAEEIILKFANGETSTLYIALPKNQQRPLQPIVFGPPSDCCLLKRSNRAVLDQLQLAGFVVSGGRALVLPIWAGSYERKVSTDLNTSELADLQRRAAARWYQDITIALDYLETRQDIDAKRAGFFGVSFGANSLAPIALAIDGRFKTAVLASGGIQLASPPPHPMIDIINYAPRIKVPVLMINGRYDTLFPHQQSQLRLFSLLGAPANRKSHIVYDVGHLEFPPNTLARDTSNWFDLKLGKVR
jgi:DNA-binding winged helix-turn-helix (wHTH) protein/dienelactone hydrolase